MDILDFLKYSGIIIAGLSGIISILGNIRKKKQLTISGKFLIVLILFGMSIAIVSDVISNKQSKNKERIAQEWNLVLDQDLDGFFIGFFILGELNLNELKKMVNSVKVSLNYPNESIDLNKEVNLEFVYRILKSESDNVSSIKMFVENKNKSEEIYSQETLVFKTKIENNYIEAISLYRSEVVDTMRKFCGFASFLPWDSLAIKDIKKVRDLVNINLSFELKEFSLNDVKVYKKNLGLTFHFKILNKLFPFQVDFGSLPYSRVVGHKDSLTQISYETTLSGSQLLFLLNKQFIYEDGLKSDVISVPDTLYSCEGQIPIKEIRMIIKLAKL